MFCLNTSKKPFSYEELEELFYWNPNDPANNEPDQTTNNNSTSISKKSSMSSIHNESSFTATHLRNPSEASNDLTGVGGDFHVRYS